MPVDQLAPMPEDWQRALAIVAHPDDLEYGAAGAVASWTEAGREVSYLLVSRGEAGIDGIAPADAAPLREREQRASAAVVGVSTVDFLDHRDGVIEYGLELRRDLAREIRRRKPELVVTLNHRDNWGPGSWNTADHRNVGLAVIDAVSDAGNRWIFPELVDEGFIPWDGVRWIAVAASPQSTHAVDISDTLDRAIASLSEHHEYLAALSDEPPAEQARTLLTTFAESVSERFGGKLATTFEVIAR